MSVMLMLRFLPALALLSSRSQKPRRKRERKKERKDKLDRFIATNKVDLYTFLSPLFSL